MKFINFFKRRKNEKLLTIAPSIKNIDGDGVKFLFWNIGPSPTKAGLSIVMNSVDKLSPDIFCIAEGTYSREKCTKLVRLFEKKKYHCYYSPMFKENFPHLGLTYNYNRNGLKIFVKEKTTLREEFAFQHQREEGKIIVINLVFNQKKVAVIFLHNYSKKGTRAIDASQIGFMKVLHDMIEIGKVDKETDHFFIMGDFNLEPWDYILRDKDPINSHFLTKYYNLSERHGLKGGAFYNPLTEMVINHKEENFCGTYYKNGNWALFDYILYDKKDTTINYEIVTEVDGTYLIDFNTTINKGYFNHGFDHLPILTILK